MLAGRLFFFDRSGLVNRLIDKWIIKLSGWLVSWTTGIIVNEQIVKLMRWSVRSTNCSSNCSRIHRLTVDNLIEMVFVRDDCIQFWNDWIRWRFFAFRDANRAMAFLNSLIWLTGVVKIMFRTKTANRKSSPKNADLHRSMRFSKNCFEYRSLIYAYA